MSEEQGISSKDEMRRQLDEAIAQASMSPALQRRKLIFWGIRQVLLCAMAWYFWEKAWMRWLFWIGLGIAAINLAMILLMPRFLAAQRRKGARALDRMDELARQPDDEV